MKILVTGSSGMLGQALCDRLSDVHEVVGIDIRQRTDGIPRLRSGQGSQKSEFYKIDLTNRDSAVQKIDEIAPEIIIHCAAYTDVDGCEKNKERACKLNSVVTETIAAASKAGSLLIYISTDFVFDGKKDTPYTEEDKPNPINVYGRTKYEGEKALRAGLDTYLIIRTSWLFGKGGENFVDIIIDKAGKEKELKVVNDQAGSPTYSIDLTEAIAEIISRGQKSSLGFARDKDDRNQILNITNSGSCSWYEFAKEIIALANIKNIEIIPIASEELNRPAKRPKMSILDNAKFNRIYAKSLPSWKDALSRYLKERKDR